MTIILDDRLAELERANAELRLQLDACRAELNEARDQRTATAEVLGVINSSPGDLTPIFEAVLDKATSLCDAAFGILWTYDGERFYPVALHRTPPRFADFLRSHQATGFNATPGTAGLGAMLDGEPFQQTGDPAAGELYRSRHSPLNIAFVELGGARSGLIVPLRKESKLLGAIRLFRQEVRQFTDKQIALLQNFAAQAVIAMENARLITETREALEQQTATAEVLGIINSSPGELAPVFDSMLDKAIRLCEATHGHLFTYDGQCFHPAAVGREPSHIEWARQGGAIRPVPNAPLGRLSRGERVVHITDVQEEDVYRTAPALREQAEIRGIRSQITVGLFKDTTLLGAMVVYRQEVRPFSEKQIALLRNFAAQAVIAMENARLITETREALEQQTATAEVLQVINSSPGDLVPVFQSIVEKAHTLCGAACGSLQLWDGEKFRGVAMRGFSEAMVERLRLGYSPSDMPCQRLVDGERVVHCVDLAEIDSPVAREGGVKLGGIRTILYVALRKDDVLLGQIVAARQEVRPFSEKEIALVESFAAQAVIAMENARLITETREALEQQTATAEVLGVINSSPGDLAPVFDAMLEKAHTLCGAAHGSLQLYDGENLHAVATHAVSDKFADILRQGYRAADSPASRALIEGKPLAHIADCAEIDHPVFRGAAELAGIHTVLFVPLRKDGAFLGLISAARLEVRPFSEKEIALLQNFAAQAVIAMENARLITETREALEQQTATAEVLGVINSSPGDLAPVFDAMLERAMRLCEAAFGLLTKFDGEQFHALALRGPMAFTESWREPRLPTPGLALHRLAHGEDLVQIEDVTEDDAYRTGNPIRRALADLGGARSALWVALRKDDALVGAFVIYRQEVRLFTPKHIELIRTFAAQAVIAMENARLITETREALEQQTATAEVLQVINSSPGDLAPVFDAMLDKAMGLCDAAYGHLYTYDGERAHPVALRGEANFVEWLRQLGPYRPGQGSPVERTIRGEQIVHVTDALQEEAYRAAPGFRALIDVGGIRTGLTVALRKEDAFLGAINVYRKEVRPFSDKQIALLQSFAAQAVIAMENARLITETREALEQQTATAEVLQVINSSPGDLQPVFDVILEKARSLCGFVYGSLNVYDGEYFRTVATRGYPDAFAEVLRQPRRSGPQARFLHGERIVHILDTTTEEAASDDPVYRAAIEAGVRTVLFVPLRSETRLLGYITANRREVRPFSEKEIALLENFAAQAVIAMENARLITETREALEQQTATAEVLQVINSSPGDLAPVFDAMLDKALRICDAAFGMMWTYDGAAWEATAVRDVPSAYMEFLRGRHTPGAETAHGRIAHGEPLVHIPDVAAEELYHRADPHRSRLVDLAGARTFIVIPLARNDQLLGAISAYRTEVRPFTDKQIALLQNFAAQAVIAMENARLITETREALEQQTATAEVLGVINNSPGDLAPVFDAMLEKAMRLCEAAYGTLVRFDGENVQIVALRDVPAALADLLQAPRRVRPGTAVDQLIRGERFIHVPDVSAEPEYISSDPVRRAYVELGGARSYLVVPLRKEGTLLGSIMAYRQEARAFTDKQIALLENFAAQAVIAIENARLITETREALEQQTATAEVLGVINSSPGDLAPVFDAIVEKAHTLCGAAFGGLLTYDGEFLRLVATHNVPAAFAELARQPFRPGPKNRLSELIRGEPLLHVVDLAEIVAAVPEDPMVQAAVGLGGIRTLLAVPLRKDGVLLGVITAYRQEVRPFSDKQIALLQSFAAQAVIAMENARLINETREALEQQTATAEVLQVINSSPGDLAPVFDVMLDKAMMLCGIAHGSLQVRDGQQFRAVAVRGLPEPIADRLRQGFHPGPKHPMWPLLGGASFVHIADLSQDDRSEEVRIAVEFGSRTLLFIPLRKDGALVGQIVAVRQEVRPFTDKQIALLQNFAAQAVIAIENARLITETREALEQQTATAEVLQVINSSPGDLAPVFDAILEKAHSLCGAAYGSLQVYDGEYFRAVAMRGLPEELANRLQQGYRGSDTPASRPLVEGEDVVQISDLAEIDHPMPRRAVELAGMRTLLSVALRKDEALLGLIVAGRKEVRTFTDKEIALLQNFAAQAVIAMENARLITETREALEQQTATAEVLQAINSSPGDLAPVFESMLEKATRLCEAPFGILRTWDGEHFHFGAVHGDSRFCDWVRQRGPIRPDRDASLLGRIQSGERVVRIADAQDDEGYRASSGFREMAEASGIRSAVTVALHKDDALLGIITVYRQEVRPFSDKQIALLENFAAQAVIAMENARLITETREALEQQTATAEVLQVINSSPGDLAPIFDAMLDKATRLCEAAFGTLFTYDGECFHAVALRGVPALFADALDAPVRPEPGASLYRIARGEPFAHFADVANEAAFRGPAVSALVELGGARSTLAVPLRKDDALLGAFAVYRQEVRPFSEKQIALLQNFAAQAVIAMENARLITETREALEQQTATAEVLGVINSSPGDLAPVFDAILEKAHTLCGAAEGSLLLYDHEHFRAVAMRGVPEPFADRLRHGYRGSDTPASQPLMAGARFVHIPDLAEVEHPMARAAVEHSGNRTLLSVPLRKGDALFGMIVATRQEVRPFSDKQIALLQNFAAQAVIAMENARLITELRQRTRDLQESLEYQTATSDVLKVISQSGTDLEPVLQMLVETAARICQADKAFVNQLRDGLYRTSASFGFSAEYKSFMIDNPIAPGRGTVTGRVALESRVIQIEDVASDREYTLRGWEAQWRTGLGVPLFRGTAVIGVIFLARSRVEPFTEKQIELVTTFADQAVIAIENARLLNDLQHRTRDLQESLEYQTATSDVLKIISQSGAELDSVLNTLVKTATRICEGVNAIIFRLRDERLHLVASYGVVPEYKDFLIAHPHVIDRGTLVGRTASERRVVHIVDVAADPEYTFAESQERGELHTMLGVPLMREGTLLGVLALNRKHVEPFTEKQIQLVTTFADQAVIAIENARLFNELRARTTELGSSVAELRMLNEVAQAVSSTLDLRTVLSTVLNASLGVTWANAGAVFRYSRAERAFRLVEAVGWDEALTRSVRELRIAETESAMGEAVAGRVPIQLPDLEKRASYPLRDITLAAGFHSALIVPLAGAERILGAIILMRHEAGEFPPETVRLMQTIASQSVLAIQNARLFREIADKSEQLALASQHKSQFLANMSHELRTPLNAILGYAELLVDGIYGVLPDRPKGVLERIQNNGKHLLALINDVLDLAKIEAGQLTLTIEDYNLPEVVKSVVTATEPLATSKGLKFTAVVQDYLPLAHGDARRVSQVLLNLVGNAIKFTDEGEVEIRASLDKGQFVLTVRDTGPGIPDADQDRIFGEFQQIDNSNTRKKGGTGLGLAISKRMVEMQGGTISVNSVLGQGSTFRVVLPVHVDEMMEAA